jgi:hypothetical protein
MAPDEYIDEDDDDDDYVDSDSPVVSRRSSKGKSRNVAYVSTIKKLFAILNKMF